MKKVIYILFAIFTFSLGFWLFSLQFFVPSISSVPPISSSSVSLCEIAENASLYQSKEIHVNAFLARGGYYDVLSGVEATDYRNGCATQVSIEISEELRKDKTFLKLDNELSEKRGEYPMRDGWAIVEVEFVGVLEENKNKLSKDKPNFIIKPKEVRQISPIQFISPKEISSDNNDLVLN